MNLKKEIHTHITFSEEVNLNVIQAMVLLILKILEKARSDNLTDEEIEAFEHTYAELVHGLLELNQLFMRKKQFFTHLFDHSFQLLTESRQTELNYLIGVFSSLAEDWTFKNEVYRTQVLSGLEQILSTHGIKKEKMTGDHVIH